MLLAAHGRTDGAVAVRLGRRHRLVLQVFPDADSLSIVDAAGPGLPPLPDVATWVPPDLALLRAGLIEPGRLHPLVAGALAAGPAPPDTSWTRNPTESPRRLRCRGAWHRIGLVDGVLTALDHDPVQIRRESLLSALTGTPLPCLAAIEAAQRRPDCLDDVRARLDHGDTAGAWAAVTDLLGPETPLPEGPLREEFETAALRRLSYGLFRAGLAGVRSEPSTWDGHRVRSPRTPRTIRR
jgi:hypothetical protein